jgi:hypothetical protein
MPGKADSEVKAMETSLGALSGLEPDEQRRVLVWLIDKLKLSGSVSLQETNGAVTTIKWNHRQEDKSHGFELRNEATTS